MVELGNCDPIYLIYKNCSELFTRGVMGQITLQETVHASEFLSGHTTAKINSVDFFFLGLLSLCCVQVGVFLRLYSCHCDGVLLQLLDFLLLYIFNSPLPTPAHILPSMCESFLDANRVPLHLSGAELFPMAYWLWMFCLSHKSLKNVNMSSTLLCIFVKMLWKKERGKKSTRRKERWKSSEVK